MIIDALRRKTGRKRGCRDRETQDPGVPRLMHDIRY
jgi:hypothetical protein